MCFIQGLYKIVGAQIVLHLSSVHLECFLVEAQGPRRKRTGKDKQIITECMDYFYSISGAEKEKMLPIGHQTFLFFVTPSDSRLLC